MQRKTKWIAGGALTVAMIAGGVGIGLAASTDDDKPPTGSTRDQVVAKALEQTGGGTVTETEVGDDGAPYSVEIRLDDGRQVKVSLDENFKVSNRETDDGSNGD